MQRSLLLLVLFALVSCTHQSVNRGAVALKVGPREAHVLFAKDEVKVGDKVMAFFNDCQISRVGVKDVPCVKSQLGQGTVTKILNENYSLVVFNAGVNLREATFVEKI